MTWGWAQNAFTTTAPSPPTTEELDASRAAMTASISVVARPAAGGTDLTVTSHGGAFRVAAMLSLRGSDGVVSEEFPIPFTGPSSGTHAWSYTIHKCPPLFAMILHPDAKLASEQNDAEPLWPDDLIINGKIENSAPTKPR